MRYMSWYCLQCCSKRVITKRWVAKTVRQRVPGHRADNKECPPTELVATMSWNDELVATDRAKTLSAGDIRSRCAAGRRALKTPLNGHSKLIYWIRSGMSSQCSAE